MLEGWVRRMAAAHQGKPSQEVGDCFHVASCWLGDMCNAHLLGFQQIRGASQPSGAELRMQLSAITTMSKISGSISIPEASGLFLWHLKNSLCSVIEVASGTAHFELHMVSLYMACVMGQPGIDWRIFPIGSLDGPPSVSSKLPYAAHTVICLQGYVGLCVFRTELASINLAEHAIALLMSGPLWSMLQAALGVSLHPFCRLPSYCAFGSDASGNHGPTSQALRTLLTLSNFVSNGLRLALDPPSSGGPPFSDSANPDAGHPASSDVNSAASREEHQPASAEQRSMVLACIAAAHALLHCDALDRLVELWHMRVLTGQLGGRRDAAGSGGDEPAGSREDAGYGLGAVGGPLQLLLLCLADVLRHSSTFICICLASNVGDDDLLQVNVGNVGRKLTHIVTFEFFVGRDTPSASFFDVPTRTQAEVTQAGIRMLSQLRSLATELLTMSSAVLAQPDQQLDASSTAVQGYAGTSWSRWEVLQAALLRGLPPEQREDWGRPLGCCNPGCTNLSGPSELQLKTYACGGGCGVRYCSRECQVQGWRLGHRHSCAEIMASQVINNAGTSQPQLTLD